MDGMVALEMMKIAPQRMTRRALIDTNARPDAIMRKPYRYLANIAAITGDFERLSERSVKSLVHPMSATLLSSTRSTSLGCANALERARSAPACAIP